MKLIDAVGREISYERVMMGWALKQWVATGYLEDGANLDRMNRIDRIGFYL